MEPVSAAISATLGLFSAASQLKRLLEKYQDAPKQIEDTLQHCIDMEKILIIVRDLITRNQNTLAQSWNRGHVTDLLASYTKGVKSTLRLIRKELPKIEAKKESKSGSRIPSTLGHWVGVKFVWNGEFFQKQLELLEKHHNKIQTPNTLVTEIAMT